MSRRIRPEKREIEPDLRYDNVRVSMFVNRLMYDGKKSVAQSLIYDSFDMIEQRVGRDSAPISEIMSLREVCTEETVERVEAATVVLWGTLKDIFRLFCDEFATFRVTWCVKGDAAESLTSHVHFNGQESKTREKLGRRSERRE